jgi:hypothetical protein
MVSERQVNDIHHHQSYEGMLAKLERVPTMGTKMVASIAITPVGVGGGLGVGKI